MKENKLKKDAASNEAWMKEMLRRKRSGKGVSGGVKFGRVSDPKVQAKMNVAYDHIIRQNMVPLIVLDKNENGVYE